MESDIVMRRYLYEISPREREVLRLLASGLTQQQIAKELGIHRATVARHIASMIEKTYVADSYQLAHYAWRNGIISIDEAWATLQAHKSV
jgi:DNA-binding NarL/FixJ family response regulator